MSDGLPVDTPRDQSAPRPPVSRNSPKPRDGRCQCCRRLVGRTGLVWDHCHDCGAGRGWCCDDCNTAITEHLIASWDLVRAYLDGHSCASSRLFECPRAPTVREERSAYTRPLYLNNGSDDGRTIQVSRHKGLLSVEQVAVVLGVSTPTARDLFNGRRRGRKWDAKQTDNGSYLIPVETLLALIEDRTQKGLL